MGNTVSAAEIAATRIIHPVHEEKSPPMDHHKMNLKSYAQQDIPPECPMHKPVKKQSECPVNHDEISPLNMVTYTYSLDT